ncbi:MAG: hypothetical protein ACK4PR_10990, partial [Gammaproteobacteria bacterium]
MVMRAFDKLSGLEINQIANIYEAVINDFKASNASSNIFANVKDRGQLNPAYYTLFVDQEIRKLSIVQQMQFANAMMEAMQIPLESNVAYYSIT